MSSKDPTSGDAVAGMVPGADRAIRIAGAIEADILAGRLVPGDRLPSEAELCAQFAVSRPTLREALGRLSAQGMIRSRRGAGGGAFVTLPETGDLSGRIATMLALATTGEGQGALLLEARIHLAMGCARLAALRRADIAPIRAEIDRQSDFALSAGEFRDSCRRLHLALAASSGNAALQALASAVAEAEFARIEPGDCPTRARARYLSFHVRIANGIAGGRPEDAEAALQDLWYYEIERAAEAAPEMPAPEIERPPRMRDLRIPPVRRLTADPNGT